MNYQGTFGENMGSPNLGVVQVVQEKIGSDLGSVLFVDKVSVTASGGGSTAGISTTLPLGAEIIDVVVQATANSGSGTAQLKTGADTPVAITDAIDMATLDAKDTMATIDQDYKFVSANGVKVWTHAEADAGDVYIYYKK